MKILITEDQLEKVINNFIEREFDQLVIDKSKKEGHFQWGRKEERSWYVLLILQGDKIWLLRGFTKPISDTFNISIDDAEDAVVKWARVHFKNPNIHIPEPENRIAGRISNVLDIPDFGRRG